MPRLGTITGKILREWAEEISSIADALCDPGQWSEEEWNIVYNDAMIPLRNAAVALSDLALDREDN